MGSACQPWPVARLRRVLRILVYVHPVLLQLAVQLQQLRPNARRRERSPQVSHPGSSYYFQVLFHLILVLVPYPRSSTATDSMSTQVSREQSERMPSSTPYSTAVTLETLQVSQIGLLEPVWPSRLTGSDVNRSRWIPDFVSFVNHLERKSPSN